MRRMDKHYTAFRGHRLLAHGTLEHVTQAAGSHAAKGPPVLVFDDATGQQVDLDPRGLAAAAAQEATAPPPRSPGRPKLGVVAREVTLLPRHWEWLSIQPGGASVALRKLVEDARRAGGSRDSIRASQERCYRFLQAIAGDLPGYEEALRALFGHKPEAFEQASAGWPEAIRSYALQLAGPALAHDEKDPSQ
jgi:hypothetical protein